MSKTIDEKVVEMKFDNRNFETNVKTSMSTLDRLKAKLNLDGASKGLDNIKNASKNVKFDNIESGLSTLEKRFSVTGIMGMTMIQNLTNGLINLGKKAANLSIGQIINGGVTRATNLENARFQLKGLLKDGAAVEAVMKNVNDSVDGTAYSLDAAAKVASQLAASGMKAGDEMFKSLRGVAGVAAMTNSSYEDIGRIYTQVAGQGRLMGDQLLQLSGRGMNAAATLAKYLGKTEAEVRDMVTKGKIDFKTFADAMDDAFGEHAKEANNTVEGAFANIKSALSRIGAEFVSPLITEKGPLVQFLNAVRERINEIKKNIEPIAKEITTHINNALTKLTENFKNGNVFGYNPFSKVKDVFKGISETISGTLAPIKKATDGIKQTVDAVKDYTKVVDEIINGQWGNGQERFDKLAEAGYNWAHAQNMVNEKLGNSFRYADNYSESMDTAAKSTEDAAQSNADLIESLIGLSDAELKSKGLTDEQIGALRLLGDVAKRTSIPIKDLLSMIENDQFNTRFLLFDSIKNVGMTIVAILKSVAKAFAEVFNLNPEGLFDTMLVFHNFTALVRNFVENNAQGLTDTLKGILSIFHLISTIVGGGVKLALQVINGVLKVFNMNILDLTGFIGKAIYNFEQWLTSTFKIGDAIGKVVEWIANGIVSVKDWVKNNETLIAIGKRVVEIFKSIKDAIKAAFRGEDLYQGQNVAFNILKGLIEGIKSFGGMVKNAFGGFINGLIDFVKGLLGIHSPSTVFMAIGGFIIAGFVAGIVNNQGDVFKTIQGIGTWIINFFKGLTIGDVISLTLTSGMILAVTKVLGIVTKAVDMLSAPMRGLANLFNSLADFTDNLSNAANNFAKGIKHQGVAAIIKSLAVTIAVLAGSLILLGKMPREELIQGAIALGSLIAVLAVFMGLLTLMSKRLGSLKLPDTGKILAITLGVAASMWLMAKALQNVGKIDPNNIGSAITGFATCVVGLGALIVVLSKTTEKLKGTKNIQKLGNVFLKIAASMLLLSVALRMMSGVKQEGINNTITVFVAIGLLLAAMAALNKWSKGSILKAGETIQAVSVSLLLLVLAMKLAGNLKPDAFWNGVKVMGVFLVFLLAIMGISKLFKGTEMMKVGGSLLMVVSCLGLMVLVFKLAAGLKEEDINQGIKVVGLFSVFLIALIAVSKSSKSVSGLTLLGVAACLLAMAAAVAVLGFLDEEALKKGVAAVTAISVIAFLLIKFGANNFKASEQSFKTLIGVAVLIVTLTVALIALSFLDWKKVLPAAIELGIVMSALALVIYEVGKMKISKGTIGTLTLLTVMMGLMTGLIILLCSVTDPTQALQSAAALSALMLAMAGVLKILDGIKAGKNGLKAIGELTLLLVPLLGLVGILYLMQGVQNAVQNTIVLGTFLLALSGVLAIVSTIGKFLGSGVITGIAGLTGLMIPLAALIAILALMQGIQNATQNAIVLGACLLALSAALAIVSAIGLLGPAVLVGVLGLVGMMAPLAIFVGLLAAMQNIEGAATNAIALGLFMTMLGDALFKIGLVGPLLVVADAALLGLIGIIGTFGVLATAIGALMTAIPQLEQFMDKGLAVLDKLAGALGTVLGKFVSNFLGAATESLPDIGRKLSLFMINAMPFIVGAKLIDDSTVEGVKRLAGALLALTGANVLEYLSKFLTNGESFSRLGSELSMFAINALPFLTIMSQVDPKVMEGTKYLAEALLALTAGNLLEQITKFFFGDKANLGEFGKQLGELAKGFNEFVANLGDFSPDKLETVRAAAEAIKILCEATKEIPGEGGFIQKIFGETNAGDFGSQLANLGSGISSFISNLGEFGEDKLQTVNIACEALKKLSEVANGLPESGGGWQKIFGENSLSNFASQLEGTAQGLTKFVNNLQFGDDALNKVDTVTSLMFSLSSIGQLDIGNLGGKLEEFAARLTSFANKLNEFIGSMNLISSESIEAAKTKVNQFTELANLISSIDSSGIEAFGERLKNFASDAMNKFTEALAAAEPKESAKQAVIALINAVIDAANGEKGNIENNFRTLVQNAAKALDDASGKSNATTAGKNFAQGFANGISSGTYLATNAASSLGKKALEAAKKSINSNSPSKETYKIGEYYGQGFVNGIKSYNTKVYKQSYILGDKAKKGLTKTIAVIAEMIESDIDSSPVIKPIVDLDNIKSSSKYIDNVLGKTSIGVNANLNAISYGMRNRSQNGNDDVINAINKLGKKLDDTGDTFNINGITYDDGSNVSEAVRTLVRATKVERRK